MFADFPIGSPRVPRRDVDDDEAGDTPGSAERPRKRTRGREGAEPAATDTAHETDARVQPAASIEQATVRCCPADCPLRTLHSSFHRVLLPFPCYFQEWRVELLLDCANFVPSRVTGTTSPCPRSVYFKQDTLSCRALQPLAVSNASSFVEPFLVSLDAAGAEAVRTAQFAYCNHCRLARLDAALPVTVPERLAPPRRPRIARTPPLMLLPLTISTIASLGAIPLRWSFSDEPATSKLFAVLDPSLKSTIAPPYGIKEHLCYRMSSVVVKSGTGARLEVVMKDNLSVSISLYSPEDPEEPEVEAIVSVSARDVDADTVSSILGKCKLPPDRLGGIFNALSDTSSARGCTAVVAYTSELVLKLARAAAAARPGAEPVQISTSSVVAPEAADPGRFRTLREAEKRYARGDCWHRGACMPAFPSQLPVLLFVACCCCCPPVPNGNSRLLDGNTGLPFCVIQRRKPRPLSLSRPLKRVTPRSQRRNSS